MGYRRRRRARPRPPTGLLTGLLVASVVGCSAPSPFDAEPPASDDGGALDDGAALDPAPEDIVPESIVPDDAAPDDDPAAGVCNEAVVAAAGETIDGQIDALGAADFESALSFASRRFQAEVDPATFAGIITAQYPILLAEPDAEFGPCAQVADLARIEVTVTATDGARDALVYLLVREEGRWSIDGATSIDEPQQELVAA